MLCGLAPDSIFRYAIRATFGEMFSPLPVQESSLLPGHSRPARRNACIIRNFLTAVKRYHDRRIFLCPGETRSKYRR
jgi:hypothetical protein